MYLGSRFLGWLQAPQALGVGWEGISFIISLSVLVGQSYLTLCNPMDCSLCPWNSLGKSGLPFPSPENLPNPGIKPGFPTLQADSLLSEPPGKPTHILINQTELGSQIHCFK